jgi:NADH:ubiquinone oxidoreductase subunit 2 (subunit N)
LSIGTVTAVIGSGDAMAVELTVTLLILRAIALIIAGAGLALIRARAVTVAGGVNQFAANQGLGWRTPLGIGLFAFGCLSLTGMPFTPGFAGTWPAVAVIAKHAGWLATLLVLSVAGGAFGVLRRLIPMLVRPDVSGDDSAGPGESRSVQLVSTAILLGGAFVTIFPQLILNFAGKLADLF